MVHVNFNQRGLKRYSYIVFHVSHYDRSYKILRVKCKYVLGTSEA